MSEVLHCEMHDSTLAGIELEGADAVLIFASLAGRTIDWEDRFDPARLRLHHADMEALAPALAWHFPVELIGKSVLGPDGAVIDPAWSNDAPSIDISSIELEPSSDDSPITVSASALTLTWCPTPL